MRLSYITALAVWLRHLANALILVLATVLLPAETWAGDKRDNCDPPTARYESVEHAVVALSQCYLRQSVRGDREFMAGLIRDGDAIVTVVSRGRYRRDQVQLKIKLKRGQSLAALWHVHGANSPERAIFSPTDVKLVKRLQVPFYLTDPTGLIRRLDPHDTGRSKPKYNRMTALRPPAGSLAGDRIGHMNDENVPPNDLLASGETTDSHYQLSSATALPNSAWTMEGRRHGNGE